MKCFSSFNLAHNKKSKPHKKLYSRKNKNLPKNHLKQIERSDSLKIINDKKSENSAYICFPNKSLKN